jgi:tape measure domain-containing protein
MGAAAELFVKVSADLKGLTSGMEKAAQAVDELGKEAQQAASPLGSLRDIIAGTAAGELLADGIKSAAQAMVGLGTQSIKLAGELEQNKVAFTTMLGSAEKADAFLRDLASFAAQTPFELRGLTDSSKRLLAFGFDAQSILPIMNSVGNAVAAVGGGKETIDGVTMALGQMAAKGKVSAEEMNQLAERGIPAWKMLATGIGVSVPEAMKRAEKGSIDANTAIVALVNGMNEKFPAMMAKQSQTITGALSNLQDSADAALTRIGQRLIKTFDLTRVVQGLSAAVSNLTAAFTTGGLLGALDKAFGPTTKAAILGLGVAITASMIPAITAAAGSLVATASAAAPFVAIAAAVAFAAYPIIKNWGEIRGTITALWDTAAQYTTAYYNRAANVASNLANLFRTAFAYIGDAIRSILGDSLTNKLLGGIDRAVGAFKGFGQMAVAPLRAVGSVASAAASNFAETWRGAMSASQGFTNQLFTAAGAQARSFGKTLTADMLGLGKAAAAAAGGAAKAAHAIKAKGVEAKRAAAEVAKLQAQTERLFNVYMKQEAATQALGARLREVDAQQAKLGNTFDVAGARAEAYKDSLGAITSAFGAFSPQALKAQQEMERFRLASENGGAATAKAFATLAESTAGLDVAREKAKVFGTTWDETSEALKKAQEAMGLLIDQGLKPGNEAYDQQLKKLRDLEAQTKANVNVADSLRDSFNDLGGSLSGVGGNLRTLFDAAGLNRASEFAQTIITIGTVITTITALIANIGAIGKAIATVAAIIGSIITAIVTAPLWAVVAGVAAIGAAVLGLAMNWEWVTQKVREFFDWMKGGSEEQKKAADEAAAALKRAQEEAIAARKAIEGSISDAFKAAGKAFIDGAQDWGNIARMKIREGVIQAVLDAVMAESVMKGMADMFQRVKEAAADPMSDAFKEAVEKLGAGLEAQLKVLEPVFKRVEGYINTSLPDVAKKADEDTRAAKAGITSATSRASSSGSNAAMDSYKSSIEKSLTDAYRKGLNLAAPGTPERDLFERLKTESNRARSGYYNTGMATGGLVTGPVVARMGEGGRNEAVLPLNENVYRQIGQGIAAAQGGGMGTQVVVQYYGNGKWTREDAQGLGRLLVSELRAMGVRA